MIRRTDRLRPAAFLSIFVAAFSATEHTTRQINDAGKKQLLNQARQKYYNLKRAGLVEFQSRLYPNWRVVLGDAATENSIKLLNALQFSVSVDAASRFRLDHRTDGAPNERTARAFEAICKDMDESTARFFATWSVFMLTAPFPDATSDYEVEQIGDHFRFSQTDNAIRTVTVTDKDFMITDMAVSGQGFTASLKPVLEKTADGYVLSGYSGDYQALSNGRKTLLTVSLDYEQVSGLRLPHRVKFDTIYDGKPAQLEWLLTDYKVKVH
jgi:hypothetical protein